MGSVNFVYSVSAAVTGLAFELAWSEFKKGVSGGSAGGGGMAIAGLAELMILPFYLAPAAVIGVASLATSIVLAAAIPSIGNSFNNNPVLYYLPTAMSAIAATFFVVKVRY
jgi:hypothetical protein